MKALLYQNGRPVYCEDYPRPRRNPGESLLKILVAAVCQTDREILKGYRPHFSGVLGHEFVAEVIESDTRSLLGRRVCGELNWGCGHCLYCESQREKHCEKRRVLGIDGHDGAFAEYLSWPDHLLHVVPDDLSTEEAVFTEPLAAALEIPERLAMPPHKNIALIGDGRLALMIAQVLALRGSPLTVIGRHEEKLALFSRFARTHVGPIPGESYEYVVDATGRPEGLELARELVRRQGTIVIKSTYAGTVTLDMSYFVVNEITLHGSRCGPFEPALNLLSRGLVELPPVEWYQLKDYERALASRAFKSGFDLR